MASILPILKLIVLLIAGVGAQNCGIPTKAIELSPISEDTTPGTILEQIPTFNIKTMNETFWCCANSSEVPFIIIRTVGAGAATSVSTSTPSSESGYTSTPATAPGTPLSNKGSNLLEIILHPSTNLTHLVDQLKIYQCLISITFNCTDNRSKTTTFIFPLLDISNHTPLFEFSRYVINLQLPWNGFLINIDNPIIFVASLDRDFDNSQLLTTISSPTLKAVSKESTSVGANNGGASVVKYQILIYASQEFFAGLGSASQVFEISLTASNLARPAADLNSTTTIMLNVIMPELVLEMKLPLYRNGGVQYYCMHASSSTDVHTERVSKFVSISSAGFDDDEGEI